MKRSSSSSSNSDGGGVEGPIEWDTARGMRVGNTNEEQRNNNIQELLSEISRLINALAVVATARRATHGQPTSERETKFRQPGELPAGSPAPPHRGSYAVPVRLRRLPNLDAFLCELSNYGPLFLTLSLFIFYLSLRIFITWMNMILWVLIHHRLFGQRIMPICLLDRGGSIHYWICICWYGREEGVGVRRELETQARVAWKVLSRKNVSLSNPNNDWRINFYSLLRFYYMCGIIFWHDLCFDLSSFLWTTRISKHVNQFWTSVNSKF